MDLLLDVEVVTVVGGGIGRRAVGGGIIFTLVFVIIKGVFAVRHRCPR